MHNELPEDPARNDLVLQLCTKIGMMMEDLCPLALDASPDGLETRVEEIARCVRAMAALADAAEALIEL